MEGGERYVPQHRQPSEGFAMQADQDSYNGGMHAKADRRTGLAELGEYEFPSPILEHAPGRFLDRFSPRPLLMILARLYAISTVGIHTVRVRPLRRTERL